MIRFHLSPSPSSAAVKGRALTGLARRRPVWLPEGAFLIEFIHQIIFPPDEVTHQIVANLPEGIKL